MLTIPEDELLLEFGIELKVIDATTALLGFRASSPDSAVTLDCSVSEVTRSVHCVLSVGNDAVTTFHSERLSRLSVWRDKGAAGIEADCSDSLSSANLVVQLHPTLKLSFVSLLR